MEFASLAFICKFDFMVFWKTALQGEVEFMSISFTLTTWGMSYDNDDDVGLTLHIS